MHQTFFSEKFYPHHFMLGVNGGSDPMPMLTALADEAKALSPDSFNGTAPMFVFEFRYMPPYEESLFKAEVRRLQYEARRHVRFQSTYKGFIVFDCGEWNNCVDEDWFDRMLQFISSMSDSWCCIFLFSRLTEAVKSKLGEYLWVKELDPGNFKHREPYEELNDSLAKKGKKLEMSAIEFIKAVFKTPGRFKPAESRGIADDICSFFSEADAIDASEFAEYALNSETMLYSLLTENERDTIKEHFERRSRFNVAC